MPATPADLMAMLDRLGLPVTTVTHAPVFTVADARAVRHEISGAHTKNLFLTDKKGRLFLVTAEEESAIDLKHLHQRLGATGRFSFGKPDLLMAALGVTPGAVTPFGAMNDREQQVTVVLDAALVAIGRINAHPLVNTATTAIAATDLIAFLKATGHDPLIVAVAETGSAEAAGAGEL